ncbi:MAG: ABC transporter ATP-binding protein [Propionibacterium sp.]|nr:ABC transporter ATP-binding protein [Propionibacterium sp.]
MSPIIQVSDLSFRYPGAGADTLRNVNLTIERGDFVAVVGGNGSGKTTLCKTFNGLVPHYWAGDFAGEVIVDGVDTFESGVAELSAKVGYVYQDFMNQLVRPTVRDEVAFGPINFGHPDHAERVAEVMEQLDLEPLAGRFTWALSGGQAHTTALAAVLALRPEIVVVDEPVAELDPARAHEIYRSLQWLNEELGLTIITIEHHAEFIAQYTKSVVLMADGAPVWHLDIDEAVNRTGELAEHGIPAPQVVQVCSALGVERSPRDVDTAASLLTSRGLTAAPVEFAARPREARCVVAQTVDVHHGYKTVAGDVLPVLRGLNLELYAGDRIALVGGNGSGKTTLLKQFAGLSVPRSGEVVIDGVNTRSRPPGKLSEIAAYLYQHPQQMFLKDSIRNDVALFPSGRKFEGWEAIVDEVLRRVKLAEFADRDGRGLSGGQQRRATLAIGLAMRPKLLLLDEPTSSLDVSSRDDVTSTLADLAQVIECTVVATHDMHLVAEWANRVIVLEGGEVAADVDPRTLFTRPDLLTRARLVPPQVVMLGARLGMDPLPLSVDELVASLHAGANV